MKRYTKQSLALTLQISLTPFSFSNLDLQTHTRAHIGSDERVMVRVGEGEMNINKKCARRKKGGKGRGGHMQQPTNVRYTVANGKAASI